MNQNSSVMNGLHKISNKIAEATNAKKEAGDPTQNDPTPNSLSPNFTNEPVTPPSPPAAPAQQNRSQTAPSAPPPRKEWKDAPEAAETIKDNRHAESPARNTSAQSLENALQRRFDDYLKSRADLNGRLIRSLAEMQVQYEQISRQAESINSSFEQLQQYLLELDENGTPIERPQTQSELASLCRKLENMRLETLRLTTKFEKENQNSGSELKRSSEIDLQSLTFSQLSNWGFAFFFPLGLILLSAALLIAIAIWGAMKW